MEIFPNNAPMKLNGFYVFIVKALKPRKHRNIQTFQHAIPMSQVAKSVGCSISSLGQNEKIYKTPNDSNSLKKIISNNKAFYTKTISATMYGGTKLGTFLNKKLGRNIRLRIVTVHCIFRGLCRLSKTRSKFDMNKLAFVIHILKRKFPSETISNSDRVTKDNDKQINIFKFNKALSRTSKSDHILLDSDMNKILDHVKRINSNEEYCIKCLKLLVKRDAKLSSKYNQLKYLDANRERNLSKRIYNLRSQVNKIKSRIAPLKRNIRELWAHIKGLEPNKSQDRTNWFSEIFGGNK